MKVGSGTGGVSPNRPELDGTDAAQGIPADALAAAADDDAAAAQATRTGAGPVAIESLAADLLRRVLDQAAPGAKPPGREQQLELVMSGMRLFAACQENPKAAAEFLKNATYEQKALLTGLKDFAGELRSSPRSAVLGGLGTLKQALETRDLPAAEARLANLGPQCCREGSVSGERGVSGSKSGAVAGRLGSASGGVSGAAGASGSARGRVEGNLGRVTARGETQGRADASGSAHGRIDTALGSASGAVAGAAGTRTNAAGAASVGLSGAQAAGKARAEVGVKGEVEGHLKSSLAKANARLAAEAQGYAEASGTAHANWKDGLRAKGHAEVGIRAQVQLDADFRTAGVQIGGERLDLNGELHAKAELSARASVDAEVAATLKPPRALLEAKGEAFAGVKAGVSGSVGVGDFLTLSGHAEAWAGAGAEAGLVAGYDDGKLRFGFNLGAAIGVGYGVGFAVEIDVAAIGNAIVGGIADLAEGALDFALNPIDGIMNIASDIGSLFVGPDEQPLDFGMYPQLAVLYPPMLFQSGVTKEQADMAAQKTEETVKRLASDARKKAAAGVAKAGGEG